MRALSSSERKLITVLVIDIVGSTALAETMDPEEWTGIMFAAHERWKQAIHRFGGTVAQFTGDGLIAFFGAPRLREDDAVRAVYAALEAQLSIQEYERELIAAKRAPHFRARVGLHTGMVIMGDVGNAQYSEYLAVGDTVTLAQQVQTAAAPGSVALSEETAHLVWNFFELEAAGEIPKGSELKLALFRVVKPRAFPLASEQGALLGRTRESSALHEVVGRLQQGRGALVSVIGEAGVGKSRLVRELRAYTQSLLPSSHWYEARGVAFSGGIYALFQQILRASLGITDRDSVESIRERLRLGAERQKFQDPDVVVQMLELMLAIRDEASGGEKAARPTLASELFATVRNTKRALAQTHPVVFVLEDMQWADAASIDLTLYDADLARELPILIIAVFRPERDTPSWKYRQACREQFADVYLEIEVEPLSQEDAGLLLDALAGGAAIERGLRARILAKTEGNPFFLEQVWGGLTESGALVRQGDAWQAPNELEITMPHSLQAILSARIDRLGEPTRRLLQAGSVIGSTFSRDLLYEVVARAGWEDLTETFDLHVQVLERHRLLVTRASQGVAELAFYQVLIQDAVYASLMKNRRRELHHAALEALSYIYAERLEERVSELSYHARLSGEWSRAYEFARRAAENAQRVYAPAEARRLYQDALNALEKMNADESVKQNAREQIHAVMAT